MTRPLHHRSGAELEHDADAGDPEALLALATMVEHGWRGLAQDRSRALELVRRAAEAGSARAACALGDRHARGDGVTSDQAEALSWWRRAAAAGNVSAMANLIPLVQSADPNEVAEGQRWLALAAAAGDPYAVNTLRHQDQAVAATSLAEFAQLSLEELAARAEASPDELSIELEGLQATAAQLDTLTGDWIERVRARWTDAITRAEVWGDPVDFPGPDFATVVAPVEEGGDTIEITVRAGVRHLQLDLARSATSWSLVLTSFEPHPTAGEQRWLVDDLRTAVAAAGVSLGA